MGSGPSGLSAAIEASLDGASVTVVEKLDIFGGNAFGTEGMFALGSFMQKEAGIEGIPVGQIVEEELEFTNYRTDAELWKRYINASGSNVDWLIEQGVEFDEVSNYKGISAFECFHWRNDHTGSNTTARLAERARELGVTMISGAEGVQSNSARDWERGCSEVLDSCPRPHLRTRAHVSCPQRVRDGGRGAGMSGEERGSPPRKGERHPAPFGQGC